MREELKLRETEHFYSQMVSKIDNREEFIYNLSAFLSAARSVLQYAFKECKTKSGGQNWYRVQIGSSNVLTFFKDKRDINVHIKPVEVSQHTSIEVTDTLYISEGIEIKQFDENGQLIYEYSSEPEQPPRWPEIPPKITNKFTFPDWSGNEDVLQLCQVYLNELKRVIADGQNKRFLTK
jgi:hypothetical protein